MAIDIPNDSFSTPKTEQGSQITALKATVESLKNETIILSEPPVLTPDSPWKIKLNPDGNVLVKAQEDVVYLTLEHSTTSPDPTSTTTPDIYVSLVDLIKHNAEAGVTVSLTAKAEQDLKLDIPISPTIKDPVQEIPIPYEASPAQIDKLQRLSDPSLLPIKFGETILPVIAVQQGNQLYELPNMVPAHYELSPTYNYALCVKMKTDQKLVYSDGSYLPQYKFTIDLPNEKGIAQQYILLEQKIEPDKTTLVVGRLINGRPDIKAIDPRDIPQLSFDKPRLASADNNNHMNKVVEVKAKEGKRGFFDFTNYRYGLDKTGSLQVTVENPDTKAPQTFKLADILHSLPYRLGCTSPDGKSDTRWWSVVNINSRGVKIGFYDGQQRKYSLKRISPQEFMALNTTT